MFAVFAVAAQDSQPMQKPTMMGKMMDAPMVPLVMGYAEGEQVIFLHTETSDPEIAKILTDMMGSPVLVVPSLAAAPEQMTARVYVITNGLRPDAPRGPLNCQPDGFDSRPVNPGEEATRCGELATEDPGVANMPLLTWPGGRR